MKGVFQSIVATVEVWYVIELYLLKHIYIACFKDKLEARSLGLLLIFCTI